MSVIVIIYFFVSGGQQSDAGGGLGFCGNIPWFLAMIGIICTLLFSLCRCIARYRTLNIYNAFSEQNEMAEGGIRNTATSFGYSVDVSCFYSH